MGRGRHPRLLSVVLLVAITAPPAFARPQTENPSDLPLVTVEEPLVDVHQEPDGWTVLGLPPETPSVVVDRIDMEDDETAVPPSLLGLEPGRRDETFDVDFILRTDISSAGALAPWFDFGAFEEVQVTASSADVSVATAGVTLHQVTELGTDKWRGSGRFLLKDSHYQSAPFHENGHRIDKAEELGFEMGGQLSKKHVWIWGGYSERDIGFLVPTPTGSQLDRSVLRDADVRLDFHTLSHVGIVHYGASHTLELGRGAGPRRAPEATQNQTQSRDVFSAQDSWVVHPHLALFFLASREDGHATFSPRGPRDANLFVTSSGLRGGSGPEVREDSLLDQYRVSLLTTSSAHLLKLGGSYRTRENRSATLWPGGQTVWAGPLLGLDEGLAAVGFQRNGTVAADSTQESVWVQDTLYWGRWVIDAGLRYDRQRLENEARFDAGNPDAPGVEPGAPPLIPPIRFPGNDASGFEWITVVPRLGITRALNKDHTVLFRANVSRYAEQLGPLPLARRVSPLGGGSAYFYFADANHNLALDPAERGSLRFSHTVNINRDDPSALTSVNVNDPDLAPALTDEISLGLERSFPGDLAVGVFLTFRSVHDIPESRSFVVDEATGQVRVATRDDYVQVGEICTPAQPCPLPHGGRQTTPRPIYDLRPGLRGNGGGYYTNGSREQRYRGVTVFFHKLPTSHWSLRGHFTCADWDWDIGDEFRRFDDPTDVVSDGLGYSDSPEVVAEPFGGSESDVLTGSRWSFNVNGVYQVAPERPWGFNLGASLTGREGYVSPPFLRVSSSTLAWRNVQLTDSLDRYRDDDLILLDARIAKDFQIRSFDLSLSLDGFNLTNQHSTLQRDRDASVDAGTRFEILEVLNPRVFRFGVKIGFR